MAALREYSRASIFADSPMTAEYRATVIKLLADQARAELVAAHTYSRWVSRAPDPDAKLYLAEIAKEETEHWYRAVALLGEYQDAHVAPRRWPWLLRAGRAPVPERLPRPRPRGGRPRAKAAAPATRVRDSGRRGPPRALRSASSWPP